jgi:hypothetical protein
MVTQTVEFDAPSISEIGSGTVTAFLFLGTTLAATLSSITENATLKGRFSGTVTDKATATYRVVVKFNGITISEPHYSVALVLGAVDGTYQASEDVMLLGTPVFGHSYQEAFKRIEMFSGASTSSGAGSGTETLTSVDGTRTGVLVVTPAGDISSVSFP